MNNEQMQDLRDFLTTTIRNEVRGAVDDNVREIVREELQPLEQRLDRFEDEVNRRFDEAAEVQSTILEAVGERFDDHEQRIQALEKTPGNSSLRLRRAA